MTEPTPPRTIEEMDPIEARYTEALHDIGCADGDGFSGVVERWDARPVGHPLKDHEPFDVDETDIPWSELVAALGRRGLQLIDIAQPWALPQAVARLVQATDHFLGAHNCDHHGYESTMAARDAAKGWLATLGPVCRGCGCTDLMACVPPCSWVTVDPAHGGPLCSSCASENLT